MDIALTPSYIGRQVRATPLGSVVIPAYDEAVVIERTLDSLFAGIEPGELDVVVVCNGCADDTATLARASGHPVRVASCGVPRSPPLSGVETRRREHFRACTWTPTWCCLGRRPVSYWSDCDPGRSPPDPRSATS